MKVVAPGEKQIDCYSFVCVSCLLQYCPYIKSVPFDGRIAHILLLFVAVFSPHFPATSPQHSPLKQSLFICLNLTVKPNTFLIFNDTRVPTLLLIGKCTNKQAITVPVPVVLPSVTVRYNSVGTASRYGLESPGIESRWGRDFPHPSRPARFVGTRCQ